jgi:hypothetical protein
MHRKKPSQKSETLVGIITPIQWDKDDQISAVALSATDDEEYFIENGEKFIDLVQQRIEAKGIVSWSKKATRSITIKKYSVIDDY